VQVLVVGGALANTFLHAQGIAVGASLCEPDLAETAKDILARAVVANCEVVLPHDAVIADALKPGVASALCRITEVPSDQMILDIGPASTQTLVKRLEVCRTLLWNGPVGAFETLPFDQGTLAIARAAAHLTSEKRLVSVAGGGDTVAALNVASVTDQFSYVSTAGGAFLEWIEGKDLPGVKALRRRT
jgi:phosphoglycerate kinase